MKRIFADVYTAQKMQLVFTRFPRIFLAEK